MENAVYEYEDKRYRFRILYDDNCSEENNPRTWDNLGTMVCFHKSYNLGDETEYDSSDYSSWDEMLEDIEKNEDPLIVLPLYLLDHSGLSINTTGFNNLGYIGMYDSGQVGFIYITKEKVREEFSAKRISSKLKDRIETYLKNEVTMYDNYLRGDIYGFILEEKEECDSEGDCEYNEIESEWGFMGIDDDELRELMKSELVMKHHYLVDKAFGIEKDIVEELKETL